MGEIMGASVIPYEPYHLHLGYTLALTCLAWFVVYLYNRYVLRGYPRMRVMLFGVAISLPLFAEIGSYTIFWLRPAANTSVGRLLSAIHIFYIQPLQIDVFLAPQILWTIVYILAALMLVSLLRFLYGSYRLSQALHLATPLNETEYAPLGTRFAQIAAEHGLAVPPVALISLKAPLAFTTGMIRSRIYISETLLELLNGDELMAVFCHELAHVYRHDNLWNWAIRLMRDIVWFVPFGHIGWRWMVRSQDEDCDAVAVKLTHEPLVLARALVKVSGAWNKAKLPPLISATAFAANHTDITVRVRQMIDLADDRQAASWRWLLGGYLLASLLLALAVLPALLGS